MTTLSADFVYIGGRRYRVSDNELGSGGEGRVVEFDERRVLKIFPLPQQHKDFQDPKKREMVIARFEEYPKKLESFPKLPPQVVMPEAVATLRDGTVIGYLMERVGNAYMLQDLARTDIVKTRGIRRTDVTGIFWQLHELVENVHAAGAVIGDFTDQNVLVQNGIPRLIDPDSMKFGNFECYGYTPRFVDPQCCHTRKLVRIKSFTRQSDWYAFTVMLFQSLMHIHPFYGGVHRPLDGGKQLRDKARVIAGVSVFSPSVRIPSSALPLDFLPPGLYRFFYDTFERGLRRPFPKELLSELRWSICEYCGVEHARQYCPACKRLGRRHVVSTGKFRVGPVFATSGNILDVSVVDRSLRLVYEEGGTYYREDGTMLAHDNEHEQAVTKAAVGSKHTIVAIGHSAYVTTSKHGWLRSTDQGVPIAANSHAAYWVDESQALMYEGDVGPVRITTLPRGHRYRLWAGDKFGIVLRDRGLEADGFVFESSPPRLTELKGFLNLFERVLEAHCSFSEDLVWLTMVIFKLSGVEHRCFVIRRDGAIIAHAVARPGEDNWLGYGVRSGCAVDDKLFVASRRGLVRLGLTSRGITEEVLFSELAPFMTTRTRVLPHPAGAYLCDDQTILLVEPTS